MKIKGILILLFICLVSSHAFAIPTLQLDIEGGTYDTTTQTIVAPGTPFTLYALLMPDTKNTLSDWYYISAALIPKVSPPGSDLGSFTFDENTIVVTPDMDYGFPPLETILQGWDSGDLARHGVYETYFEEFGFQFSSSNIIDPYNTQDRAKSGGSIPTSGSGMYYAVFNVDTSRLDPNYVIHFDLYNEKLNPGDIDISQFAPFSHDAEGYLIPEPTTLLLVGGGLVGIGIYRRRLRKR